MHLNIPLRSLQQGDSFFNLLASKIGVLPKRFLLARRELAQIKVGCARHGAVSRCLVLVCFPTN